MQGFDCRNVLSQRARCFKVSPIQQLSLLAQQCNAINLAEGFPDFPAPTHIKEAAIAAITADFNQYRHVQGVCDKVASAFEMAHGVKVDPSTEVAVCCGQSEALAAAILAVVEVNDEVVILEPAYDTYEACTILAGGKPIFVGLDPPLWSLDMKKLEAAISLKTKAVIINSPHNPTGKVFKEGELADIANLCCQHKCLAITDEVYEHITFEDVKHMSLASFPGMKERTIVTSSLSKTFSVTGWRIGWAIAPSAITSAIRAIHSKLTDSAPAPFQEAALAAFHSLPDFYRNVKQDYQFQRDYVCRFLAESGFIVHFKPQGSCFVFAELPFEVECDDVEYVAEAISTLGVAFVPGCAFFHEGDVKENVRLKVSTDIGQISRMHGMSKGSSDVNKLSASNHYKHRYIRVAFCKGIKTLQAAESALRRFHK